MAQRYKINGIVKIPAPIMGPNDLIIDSPEFEISQGRQCNNTAYIGVKYYYMQGIVKKDCFVEYPIPFEDLNETEMNDIIKLITSANINILAMPRHKGAIKI
jgi:hypothetical protein